MAWAIEERPERDGPSTQWHGPSRNDHNGMGHRHNGMGHRGTTIMAWAIETSSSSQETIQGIGARHDGTKPPSSSRHVCNGDRPSGPECFDEYSLDRVGRPSLAVYPPLFTIKYHRMNQMCIDMHAETCNRYPVGACCDGATVAPSPRSKRVPKRVTTTFTL